MTLLAALIFCVLTVSGPVPGALGASGRSASAPSPPSRSTGLRWPLLDEASLRSAIKAVPAGARRVTNRTVARDTWRWPLGPPVPPVMRGFSPPPSPWLPGHRGVDLAASPGDPVYAAGPGRVSYAGALAGRDVVAITHGELRTTYLPVRPVVPVGRDVAAGARIGTVEADRVQPPHCTQACLHWGLLRGATYLDPLALVRPVVRLLPLWRSGPAPDLLAVPAPPPPRTDSKALPDPQAPSGAPLSQTPGRRRATRDQVSEAGEHMPPGNERPLRPALSAASTATAGMMTCLVLGLALALVRRGRTRPRSRPGEPHQRRPPPPNVIDLAQERRRRRPPAPQHPR